MNEDLWNRVRKRREWFELLVVLTRLRRSRTTSLIPGSCVHDRISGNVEWFAKRRRCEGGSRAFERLR